jgi:biopolymer transport protein ExbB
MFLSVVALALAIEHVMTIRPSVLMPEGLAEKIRELSKQGHFTQAEQSCKLQPSVLAFVLQAGLSEIDGGWSAVEKAMEDALADQAARLFRKIEYLSVIGNIAPMLGLLGTVIGMVMAFREVALTQGAARAADLAEGIYLALVTTVQGLVVAIPALSAFAYFRNRVDQMVAEIAYQAQHAMTPLKRARRRRPMPSAPPPSATTAPPRERKP